MIATRFLISIFSVATLILCTDVVSGQNYPNKPIRIVTALAGTGNDLAARMIAQGISGPLGRPVVIDNRPNILTAETVAKAPADGYSLLLRGGT